jgi:methylated-DNA-[protein]-cysteine S-methyltransferase
MSLTSLRAGTTDLTKAHRTTEADLATVETPIGPFTIVAEPESGAVLASGWTADPAQLLPLIHPSLRPSSVIVRPELGQVTQAVREYHQGNLQSIDDIVVRQRSGPFLEQARETLRTVPAGDPVTYAVYAALSGRPAAIRAAASACARNATALFVPCHRVLQTGGGIGGFRWGTEVKKWLINHEKK